MGKLAEIESAVELLSPEEQGELLRFLALRMGLETRLIKTPGPRDIPIEQIREWVAEDEEGMRRFREGQ